MKLNLKERMKQENGITLIALVITIIVLLILAGVTIATLTGENGILNQANQAKIKSDIAEVKEKAQLDIANWTAEKLKNGEDTTLDDATVKSIIESANQNNTNKYYSELTDTSIITKQGNEILFSEFYKKEEVEGVDYSQLHVGDYISNYPVYYDNVDSYITYYPYKEYGYYPQDRFNGWRVLSVDSDEDNSYVRIVSAGVPLSYFHGNDPSTSIENLTTKFFNTKIMQFSMTDDTFYKSGFKIASADSYVIYDINSVKELFINKFTATYSEGESAIFTDLPAYDDSGSVLYEDTYVNPDVEGDPKVQAMTYFDLRDAWEASGHKDTLYDISDFDLLAIPSIRDGSYDKYSTFWLASRGYSSNLLTVNDWGRFKDDNYYRDMICGVRPVVTLRSNVKFTPAKNNINDTQTWDISVLNTKTTPNFDPKTLTIGTAVNTDKYGWKVTNYNVRKFETGGWRLFFQDDNYTYLISDNCIGDYRPRDYSSFYPNGSFVSTIGQKLNPKISSLFTESNTNLNIRATAWLTDTSDTSRWGIYENDDAVFAIRKSNSRIICSIL